MTARKSAAKEIVVNDPLVYHGLRFYQASYWIDSHNRRCASGSAL